MRATLATAILLVACDGGESSELDGSARIEFFVPGTEEVLEDGADLAVYLRLQGVFGAIVDMHVIGVPQLVEFSIAVEREGEVLADQRFLPTSTARELEDGSIAISDLPIVFFDTADPTEVDGEPATLAATMATEPPTTGETSVVLQRMD